MPTTSQVDNLLDDANIGRVDATDAIIHAQRTAVLLIKAGRAILTDLRAADHGLNETMAALYELRQLRPTVQGKRTDILVREEMAV